MINKQKYTTVALGGTFDHFHAGHRDFIDFAASLGKKLIIGVTDEKMVLSKNYAHSIQPHYQRKQAVSQYCAEQNIHADLITIHDQYGSAIENSKIQALICTTDTIKGAEKINEVRAGLNLSELPIHINDLVQDNEKLAPISSVRIRAGEINRDGVVYASQFQSDIQLTESMRKFFAAPHGEILAHQPDLTSKNLKILVGDTTLKKFMQEDWKYNLGIFDHREKRKPSLQKVILDISNITTVNNPAGEISKESIDILIKWCKNPTSFEHLFVKGEEDLLAVPAVLLAPLNTKIYYGQPNAGIIETTVTEQLKEKFLTTLHPNLSRK